MSARQIRGVCRSGKTRYRNRRAVVAGIDKTRFRHLQHYRRPAPRLWFYRCPLCGGWHMTSSPPRRDAP